MDQLKIESDTRFGKFFRRLKKGSLQSGPIDETSEMKYINTCIWIHGNLVLWYIDLDLLGREPRV